MTSGLWELTALAGQPERVDALLDRALDALADVIPFELATVLELDDQRKTLRVRCARGPLATPAVRQHRLDLAQHPTLQNVLESRRARLMNATHHTHGEGDPFDTIVELAPGHSCMVVPIFSGDKTLGLMTFDNSRCDLYGPETVNVATIYGRIVGLGMAAAKQAELLNEFRHRLEERNRLLAEQDETDAIRALDASGNKFMRRLAHVAKQVASTDAPVLILGETGTGKELLAQAIHAWSRRRREPFVKLNCAALPEPLIESELFGHKKGAFSGAVSDRAGRFVVANGGTLLLDEVGDLPAAMQVKLLRVLQEGTFEPVGSDKTITVDVRIIAATHVDLESAIDTGTFREDLYYRLNVFPLELPPLRDRLDDLPALVGFLLDRAHRQTGRGPWSVSPSTIDRMRQYDWPGNVRELINVLERSRVLAPSGPLEIEIPTRSRPISRPIATRPSASKSPATDASTGESWPTLRDHEREYIVRVLRFTNGRVYGPHGAATLLDLPPTTLQSRMKKLGITKADL